jgi:hypothetical protein
MPFESFDLQGHDEDADFKNAYMSFIQSHSSFDDSFIKKKEKVKATKKQQSLDEFIGEAQSEVGLSIEDIIEDLDGEEK